MIEKAPDYGIAGRRDGLCRSRAAGLSRPVDAFAGGGSGGSLQPAPRTRASARHRSAQAAALASGARSR